MGAPCHAKRNESWTQRVEGQYTYLGNNKMMFDLIKGLAQKHEDPNEFELRAKEEEL